MNRYLIMALLCCIGIYSSAQIRVPKNFYLVKGASPVGREDYYTDGQFRLFEDTPFQAEQRPSTDEGTMNVLTSQYGISFNKLRRDFYYGSGYSSHLYKCVVVSKGIAFVLTSKFNNEGFVNYSKWLKTQISFHQMEGDQMNFK